jgi:hypothetical protein
MIFTQSDALFGSAAMFNPVITLFLFVNHSTCSEPSTTSPSTISPGLFNALIYSFEENTFSIQSSLLVLLYSSWGNPYDYGLPGRGWPGVSSAFNVKLQYII